MLQLKNIKKVYGAKGKERVEALKGISVEFRESEFVSILGQSGCGKTTLLNIIGGLDRYTSGDLIINGRSTKQFKDRDWDTYRNHSIGFVFQNYNLIPHQNILSNVELALTLAGIGKKERRKRAIDVLETVGLKDKIYKKPTELSGGQMQRVAIARALVGNPDILLADEPTGALDSNTSVQIMDLLKKIAKNRLVIMVTHNAELAEKYSTRIIKLLDGKVVNDSNPYEATTTEIDSARENFGKFKKTRINFKTALSLSFKNLLTKKGRTILTSFAGSIGIIGIALILSLSNGMQEYITKVQKETLSQYPIQIDTSSIDLSSFISKNKNNRMNKNENSIDEIGDNTSNNKGTEITSKDDITNNIALSSIIKNNLSKFKEYLDNSDEIKDYASAVQYSYNIDLQIYDSNTENGVIKLNPNTISLSSNKNVDTSSSNNSSNSKFNFSMMTNSSSGNESNVFKELIDNNDLLSTQYKLLAGKMPENYDEMVLIIDEDGNIPESVLYALNIKDRNELENIKNEISNGETVEIPDNTYTYNDFIGKKYKLITTSDYYEKENGKWEDKSKDKIYLKDLISKGEDVEIVGVMKVRADSTTASASESGIIGYTHSLTEHEIAKANESSIVKKQLENADKNILTGINFDVDTYIDTLSSTELKELEKEQVGTDSSSAQVTAMMLQMSDDEIKSILKSQLADNGTQESNLQKMGYINLNNPSSINIYPKDFSSKDGIKNIIEKYNQEKRDNNQDEYVITYNDYVGLMMSSITTIINTITYVLIAFVAISLIVSSIMIAIITYISVLERTKEIGILRSIGASKKDVSRVFNAETFIEGLIAGLLGISITLLLCIPINSLVLSMFKIANMAKLPLYGGIGLILLSIILTMIAGIVPSKMASKKDPAVALRTE